MRYSNLVKVCEDIWDALQAEHQDIPDVVVTVGTGGRRAATLYGHFANEAWEKDGLETGFVHEVLLVAEQLKRPAHEIFTTLLHEAVHGIATTRGIKDVSGQRHNKRFAALCWEVGLIPPESPDKRIGYSAAVLSHDAQKRWEPEIQKLEAALGFVRRLKLKDKETRKTTWVAECDCMRKIRIGKKALQDFTAEDIKVKCGACDTDFILEDDEDLEKLWQF